MPVRLSISALIRARFSAALLITLMIMPLVSLSADSVPGDPIFRFVAGGEAVEGAVIAGDGSVYAACEDRYLYRLTEEGKLLWRADLRRKPVTGVTLTPDGGAVLAIEGGTFVALNQAGQYRWSFRGRSEDALHAAAGADGRVYISYRDGYVAALNPAGRILWEDDLDEGLTCPPVVDSFGEVIAADGSGNLRVLQQPGGTVIYAAHTSLQFLSAGSGGALALITEAGGAVVLRPSRSPENGMKATQVLRGTPVATLLWDTDGALFAIGTAGELFRLDRAGDVDWKAAPPGEKISAAYVGRRGIVALTAAGERYELDSDGHLLGRGEPHGGGSPRAVSAGPAGPAVVSGANWVLYGTEGRTASASPWPVENGLYGARRAVSGTSGSSGSPIDSEDHTGPTGVGTAGNAARPTRPADFDLLYIEGLLSSGKEATEMQGLGELASYVEDGRLQGKVAASVELLSGVLTGPWRSVKRGDSLPPFPRVRSRAALLLGRIGTLPARTVLIEAARLERDSSVLDAIITGLGEVGIDPEGRSVRTITDTFWRIQGERGSVGVDTWKASVEALASIYSLTGLITDDAGIDLLSRAMVNAPSQVSERAAKTLQLLGISDSRRDR